MSNKKTKVIGIDLGTTFSAVAYVNEFGVTEIVPNKESERITPSVILFDGPENAIVGKIAKQSAVAEPDNIVEFVKREMGKGMDKYSKEFFGKKYSAETLSAVILKKLKNDAEERLGEIKDAVITVPAYFNDRQREATKNAGIIAGFNVLQILNEPTAAAIAFGVNNLGKDQNIFVFDLGGGTFDVTVMKIEGNNIAMIATNGDHQLGGKDWDDAIITYVASVFEKKYSENPLQDPQAYQDIQLKAIQAKETLSRKTEAKIVCNYHGNFETVILTKEKFEELTHNLLEKCKSLTELVIEEDAKMTWNQIDTVLLVGGSTRMPMIKEMVQSLSGKTPSEEINPDEAVAIGAAIQATLTDAEEKKEESKIVDKTGKAIGPIEIRNVTSHTLGVTIYNAESGKMEVAPIIKRFTEVPCEITDDKFSLMADNQRSLNVPVMEGESSIPEECVQLGKVVISDLPPGLPMKTTKVSVTFEFDKNSILHVSAEVAGKKEMANIKIEGGLTEEEIKEEQQHIQRVNIE
ncbi:MAG: Hsp70 family protein [bacterium]